MKEIDKAAEKVTKRLKSLSKSEFKKKLKEHENGDIAQIMKSKWIEK